MFKAGSNILLNPLKKLFNFILRCGHYPASWAEGRIISIHKKGDKNDPSNYRGITISSSLGKIFNSILNSRLCSFLDSNSIIHPEQIGFRKKHRASDHMFILKNLIANYKKNKKCLFITFIDFQKAFDTVWHTGLLYKLLRIGVSSSFFSIIESMYKNISLSVQIGTKISPAFGSCIGVRQGDNLSPTLFNIFINDIPKLFDNTCDPAKFGDLTLSSLLYADDLILFSETNEGMQRAINKLKVFCNEWALSINAAKSKVMCVNQHLCRTHPSVNLGSVPLTLVSTYKYLGLEFSNDGKTEVTKKDLYNRALKAYFKIVKTMHPLPKPRTLFHLFDHLIKPILLYGCEIWTPMSLATRTCSQAGSTTAQFFNKLKVDFPVEYKFVEAKDPIEKLHLKFCKFVMGVHTKTTNLAVYGDCGRYPLYIDQITQCVKFYHHLENTENELLQRFYKALTSHEPSPRDNELLGFLRSVQSLGKTIIPTSPIKKYLNLFRRSLQGKFSHFWSLLINNDLSKRTGPGGNKLRSYRLFKRNIGFEPYLNLPDYGNRKSIAKLRTSAHRLRIETDRFDGRNRYVPPDQRICTQCHLQEVEDEIHFLTKCPAFSSQRASLFDKFLANNPNFSTYNDLQKFIWILSVEDMQLLSSAASYIKTCMELRK